MAKDLFDSSNKYYNQAVDDPLKITEPHGRNFIESLSNNQKRGGSVRHLEEFDKGPSKRIFPSQNENKTSDIQSTPYQQPSGKRKIQKKVGAILLDKENKVEQIYSNQINQRLEDMKFVSEVRPEATKSSISLIPEPAFKNAYQNFNRKEYVKAYYSIVNQIKMEVFDNLKALKCQNLLKILPGFVKKTSQVSTFYTVLGTLENISYLEYLKKEVELSLTTSILSVWMQKTPKISLIQQNVRWNDLETYTKELEYVDINNADSVRSYVKDIKEEAEMADTMWEGFDLYLGLKTVTSAEGYVLQEKESQKRLLFDLVMVCNTLAAQQNCIIKFYTTFSTKTLSLLFMFFKVFKGTVMCKPRTSHLGSCQQFLLCKDLKVDLARKLGALLLEKYEEFLKEDVLPFEIKIMTQDQKFSSQLIDRYLKNIVGLHVDYFESEEVSNKKYEEIIKKELESVFAQPFYKDVSNTFEIEDIKLKNELGLKQNFNEVYKQIESGALLTPEENPEEKDNLLNQKKQQQFSDDEDNKEEYEIKDGFVKEFADFSRKKGEEERKMQEERRQGTYVPIPKKDPTVINQRNDRDLSYTKELTQLLGIAPPPFSYKSSKRRK